MTDPRKIRVLVVDDSTVTRLFLVHLLESDPRICVIGTANDGQAAIDFIARDKPDVVLMDVHMPRMDGFEATRSLMETTPLPIVICSSTLDTRDVSTAFQALVLLQVLDAGNSAEPFKKGRRIELVDRCPDRLGQQVDLVQSPFIFVIVFIVDPTVRFIQLVEFGDTLLQHARIKEVLQYNMRVRT